MRDIPAEWVNDLPDNWVQGLPLHVETDDTDGPWRVYGQVLPPPGERYVGAGSGAGYVIPERFPDETFRDFHVNYDHELGVPIGAIPLKGAQHPKKGVDAVTAEQARDFIQRRGNPDWTEQLLCRGRIWRHPDTRALVFSGHTFPHVTREDADIANSTTISADIWPHEHYGGQLQFVGVSKVGRTAFPHNAPAIAANLENGPVQVCWLDGDGAWQCDPCEPVAAELSEAEAAELQRQQQELREAVEEQGRQTAQLLNHLMTEQDLGVEQRFQNVEADISGLRAQLEELTKAVEALAARQDQPDSNTDTALSDGVVDDPLVG